MALKGTVGESEGPPPQETYKCVFTPRNKRPRTLTSFKTIFSLTYPCKLSVRNHHLSWNFFQGFTYRKLRRLVSASISDVKITTVHQDVQIEIINFLGSCEVIHSPLQRNLFSISLILPYTLQGQMETGSDKHGLIKETGLFLQ